MGNVLFVISGPSGVGKGTLVSMLIREDERLALSISCTTRQPRKGEQNGRDYWFLSEEEFLRRIQEGDFLEYDRHFGNYYGTPRSFVLHQLQQRSVILEIDVVGALKVAQAFRGGDEGVRVVLIMIVPPNIQELERRLCERASEGEAEVKERLQRVRYELTRQEQYDHVLINDELPGTMARLKEIIDNEVSRS